ncbi:MAG TPA: class I SAM-dependent methyltransferase [Puia sp.]|jgi:cyclopropane fatty-acyl-phospholipid synthase-like methyltransferase|nr:class I SAM-dependent methyltransferase [Puia sp.]
MLTWQPRHNQSIDWIIRQLDLQPHQHLLEVGCGSGRLLAAIASRSRSNFIAALTPSVIRYRQAARRNTTFIQQDTVQLHLGQLQDLPYPPGYFHTIYGSGSYYRWTNFSTECLRLANLLRTGGRLILLSQPGHYSKEEVLRTEAAHLQAAFLKAGLTDIHSEFRDLPSGVCLSVTGVKPLQQHDYQLFNIINNRLLNSEAYFISKVARIQQ